jgi:hypothetical protein
MRRRTLLSSLAAALAAPALPLGARPAAVDLLLLLAVDVSRSMDETEARLQRDGYVEALRDPAVLAAIAEGPLGAIGLSYLEWSGPEHQMLLLPWTCIDSPRAAEGCAARLHAAPVGVGTWTAIGTALDRTRAVFESAPFAAERRVIDVSGDGVSNAGGPVDAARDRVLDQGIVINGLPVMRDGGVWNPIGGGALPLDAYFRELVVGGPGAFVLPAEDFRSFGQAVRRKLVQEIAAREAPAGPRFAGAGQGAGPRAAA